MTFVIFVVRLFGRISSRFLLSIPWMGKWWLSVAAMSSGILQVYLTKAITDKFRGLR